VLTSNLWPNLGLLLTMIIITPLWIVSVKPAARDATAIVHVCNSEVDVRVDDHFVHIEERIFEPLVFALSPGTHDLSMSRSGELLYHEKFEIRSGEEQVLTAWCPSPANGFSAAAEACR